MGFESDSGAVIRDQTHLQGVTIGLGLAVRQATTGEFMNKSMTLGIQDGRTGRSWF